MNQLMRNRTGIRSENGQTMVELTLVFPVLALILFAIVQFGIAFNDYLALTDAVRAGSRKATVSRFADSPTTETEQAIKDAADGLDPAKIVIEVESSWEPGEQVRVKAAYPYDIKLPLVDKILSFEGSLESEVKERVE
jgi:Flp pilus assembly protein TadG